jgi:hypothetical protein
LNNLKDLNNIIKKYNENNKYNENEINNILSKIREYYSDNNLFDDFINSKNKLDNLQKEYDINKLKYDLSNKINLQKIEIKNILYKINGKINIILS